MDANPILAEAVRGNWVENRHRGAFVIVDANGQVIASAGDIERPIFPRSAIKSMQAVAIFDRHAVESSGAHARRERSDLAVQWSSSSSNQLSGRQSRVHLAHHGRQARG